MAGHANALADVGRNLVVSLAACAAAARGDLGGHMHGR